MSKNLSKVKSFNNSNFPNSRLELDNSLFSIEKIKKHKILFNRYHFGNLKFYFGITYKKSNLFLSFYSKSEKYPTKVFTYFKQSIGLENRDKIKKALLPKVFSRGRRKTNSQYIYNKYNLVKNYIIKFIKHHPEITAYKRINIIWKIYKIDHNFNNLANQPFLFFYNINVIKRILKERIKDEIYDILGLREKLNLSDHEIIYNYYIKKNNFLNNKKLFYFNFKKNKKQQIYELKLELISKLKLLNSEGKKRLVTEIARLRIDLLKKNVSMLNVFDIIKSRISNVYKLVTNKHFNFEKNKYYVDSFKEKEMQLISQLKARENYEKLKFERYNAILKLYDKYLEKIIILPREIINAEQPMILHKFSIKAPHNGCRPKKARRLKRSRKKK